MPNSHMGQLDIFVKRLRATYPKGYVPDFDPNDGGIIAEILLLFEKPGCKTDPSYGGSGFISQDNDDGTANATKKFIIDAGINREKIVIWNTIPAWNGTRKITSSERKNASNELSHLLNILKNVKSIILVGKEAQKMEKKVNLEKYRVIKSIHPSPINKKFARTDWENIPSIWARAI